MRHLLLPAFLLLLLSSAPATARQRSGHGPAGPLGPALSAALVDHTSWTATADPNGAPRLYDQTVVSGRFIYAGTERGLSRSLDGGRTWTQHAVAPGQPPVQTIAAHGPLVWVGTPEGAYRSLDAGRTWVPIQVGMGEADVRHMIRVATGTLFAATESKGPDCNLFRSRSDGQLWSCVEPDGRFTRIDDILEEEEGQIAVLVNEVSFWTTDEGFSWRPGESPRSSDDTLAVLPVDIVLSRNE